MPDVLGYDAKLFYNFEEVDRYDSTRNIEKTQREMTERALEIMDITGFFLDVGSGTGFSMQVIKENGNSVLGIDISKEMNKIAKRKGFSVCVGDMLSLPFADDAFDGMISISTIQWVSGETVQEVTDNYKSLAREFFRVLKNRGECVIQFYPRTEKEFELVQKQFIKAGFSATLVIDGEGTRKEKKYLLLKK